MRPHKNGERGTQRHFSPDFENCIVSISATFFRMWQNALIFAAVGAAGYLILALVVSIEVLLETARAAVIGMMKY